MLFAVGEEPFANRLGLDQVDFGIFEYDLKVDKIADPFVARRTYGMEFLRNLIAEGHEPHGFWSRKAQRFGYRWYVGCQSHVRFVRGTNFVVPKFKRNGLPRPPKVVEFQVGQ